MTFPSEPKPAVTLNDLRLNSIVQITGLSHDAAAHAFFAYAPRDGVEADLVEQIVMLQAVLRDGARRATDPQLAPALAARFHRAQISLQRELRTTIALLVRRQAKPLPAHIAAAIDRMPDPAEVTAPSAPKPHRSAPPAEDAAPQRSTATRGSASRQERMPGTAEETVQGNPAPPAASTGPRPAGAGTGSRWLPEHVAAGDALALFAARPLRADDCIATAWERALEDAALDDAQQEIEGALAPATP